jgi:hypothetical protein
MKHALPLWLIVVVIIETLPMFLGPYLAMFIPTAIPGLSGGEQVSFAASIYSARNLAVGVALLVALLALRYLMQRLSAPQASSAAAG